MSDRQVFDHLDLLPAADNPALLAPPVAAALHHVPGALVFTIDPTLADTAALCEAYRLPLDSCANCVIVAGRRGDTTRHVACMALATTRVDVNATVRRRLDARKASFAPMDFAVESSGMEYGGITPVGLPEAWPVWVDEAVSAAGWVCIGSGVRGSKLVLPATDLLRLPGAEVVAELAR
ncbi:MAG TPA: YbaK/EbsC family protein [Propionibacteriaceae bacterium]|nr:YbaK/EbsC family protein [Propionibacteriaceae bacterium]